MDETFLANNEGDQIVVAKKGQKVQKVGMRSKGGHTAAVTVCADGTMLPIYVLTSVSS
jgi:hypothetical protein